MAGLHHKQQLLTKGVEMLIAGIRATDPLIQKHNELIFDDVTDHFKALVGTTLPGVEVHVCRVGGQLHEGGAQFKHRLRSFPGCEWRQGLSGLSGGQRTLICLSFLLATRLAGANTSCLLLMDEVDAALDSANQELAAHVIHAMCQAPAAGGKTATKRSAQLIAVSHNPAFQQRCEHVVKVTRGPHGTTTEGSMATTNADAVEILSPTPTKGRTEAPSNKKSRRK